MYKRDRQIDMTKILCFYIVFTKTLIVLINYEILFESLGLFKMGTLFLNFRMRCEIQYATQRRL